jgi:hypothetical protein
MSDDATPGWMPPGEPPANQSPADPNATGHDPVWQNPSQPSLPPQAPAGGAVPAPPSTVGVTPPVSGPPQLPTTQVGHYPAAVPAPPTLSQPMVASGAGDASGRSKKVLVGAVVGVLALGGAGVFAATQLTASNSGGADSPEALGEAVMASLEEEDALGVIDLLLPGERETFRGPFTEMISELTRLEVLSEDASLSDLQGFDVVLADRSVSVAETNVDDIVNITMTATATVNVDGVDLPIGEIITDNFGDEFDIAELDATQTDLPFELPMTAVERDGRWYLSGMYTIAEAARADADIGEIPQSGIEAQGGDSPEGAIDVMLEGVEQLDLSVMIAALNPNEAEALQRYAPLFIDEAQQEIDDAPLDWQVTDVAYDVEGSGSKRSVTVTELRIDGEFEEERDGETATVAFSAQLNDGCLVIESEDESVDTCDLTSGDLTQDMSDSLFGTDGLDELSAEFEDILADYDPPGITVNEVDGQWFVSPIGTGFDQLFALMRALDRGEIERAGDAIGELFSDFEGMFDDPFGGDFDIEDPTLLPPPIDEVPELSIPDDTVFDTVPGEDVEVSEEDRLYEECLAGTSAADVATCLQTNIDAGLIPEYYMPIELAHLECGVGDVYLGVTPSYELSNEEYTAIITAANACFTELIAAGTVVENDVPPEYLRVECAEGRNPWNFDDPDNEELFDRWLDCIYA